MDKNTLCFLCRCHGAIGDILNLEALDNRLRQDPRVLSSGVRPSLCLEKDLDALAAEIKSSGTSRVLIGACSFLSRGDVMLKGLEERGVETSFVEWVDLREGCAWIHPQDPRGAEKKARNLLEMGLVALERREAQEAPSLGPCREVLVIGAGPAGLSAAGCLGRAGLKAHLVDRAKAPGGMLNLISSVGPEDIRADEMLSPLLKTLDEVPEISFHPASHVVELGGAAGDFRAVLRTGEKEETIRAGAVILATGAQAMLPGARYRAQELEGVIPAMAFERLMKEEKFDGKHLAFIQCVGVRDKETPYCSAICCPVTLKQAMRLKERDPAVEVTVLHRDIMCPGSVLQRYHREATARGVRFVRFDETAPPAIEGKDRAEAVLVTDVLSGAACRLPADTVVLSTPLTPHRDMEKIAGMLGLSRDCHGFFEVGALMHPLETEREGVFVCGSARWPVLAGKAMTQGEAAAMKVCALFSREDILSRGFRRIVDVRADRARVDGKRCSGCGTCVAACPNGACSLEKIGKVYRSVVDAARCSGCGTCASLCPNGSIKLPGRNAAAMGAMLQKAFV